MLDPRFRSRIKITLLKIDKSKCEDKIFVQKNEIFVNTFCKMRPK